MYVRKSNLGNFGSCNNPAIARLDTTRSPCGQFSSIAKGDYRASAAATSYSDALLAAHAKNKSRYDSMLSRGDGYKNKLSGSIVNWLNAARAHVTRIGAQAFARSDVDAARFARGQQAASEMFTRYKDYSDQAPDSSRILERGLRQSIKDIISGDPFRAAKKQKWGPNFLYSDDGGFNYKTIGLILGGTVLAVVAVYSFAGGLGQGLAS